MAVNEEELKEELKEEATQADNGMTPEEAAAAAEAEAPEEAEAAPETEPAEEIRLADKVGELEAEIAAREDKLKRLQADFENFRRRTGKEKEELSVVVTQQLLKAMLPLLDNFERALSATGDAESFRTGVEMIYKQFTAVLKEQGLEYINTEGVSFDPNYHQAVMRVQDSEKEDDTIAAELQKGYMVKGRVIRPSMVQVVSN